MNVQNKQNKMNESLRNVELANQEYVDLMDCMAKNKIWVMRSAQKTLKISIMSTTHIENALCVAKRALRHDFESDVRREYYQEIIPHLQNELNVRNQCDEDVEDDCEEDFEDDFYNLHEQDECSCEDEELSIDECLNCEGYNECEDGKEFIEEKMKETKRKEHAPIYFHSPILEVLTEFGPTDSYEDVIKKMHEKLEGETKEFKNLDKLGTASNFTSKTSKEENVKVEEKKEDKRKVVEKTLTIDLSKDAPEDVARKIVSIFEEGSKCSNDGDKTDKNNEKKEYHAFVESVLDNVIGRLL